MKAKTKHLNTSLPVPNSLIERRIYIVRGQKIMISSDLAELYDVKPKALVQAVKRNVERFPADFMFQLKKSEFLNLKSQFVTSSWGGVRRAIPYAFTEHGIAMLSSVLNSKRAVEMNILIVRAFIKMRQMAVTNTNLEKRVDKIEDVLKLHDEVLITMTQDIKKLKNPPKANAIGFRIK